MTSSIDQDQGLGAWKAGEFTVTTDKGSHPVAGWINGVFALDFRVWDIELGLGDEVQPGWTLTHLPTGFQACGIMAQREVALGIADEIANCADWDFNDPAEAKSRAAKVRPIFEKYPDIIWRRHAMVSSTFRDAKAVQS